MSTEVVTTVTCDGCGFQTLAKHLSDVWHKIPYTIGSKDCLRSDRWDMCPDCWSLFRRQMREHTFRDPARYTA